MDIKEFYKPEVLLKYPEILRNHLLNKYEESHGILEIVRNENVSSHYGISKKEVLENSLRYYNEQQFTKVHWFYVKDLKEITKDAVAV